jgi:hypothetical protein
VLTETLLVEGPALDALAIEEVRFFGGPSFKGNNTMYIPNPDPINYIGDPDPNVDAAWENLTYGKINKQACCIKC